jgi:hypothetical protein
MGPSLHHYSESLKSFTMDEFNLYGKFSLWGKSPLRGLDASFDIEGTINDLAKGPTTLVPAFLYWQMSLRAGYSDPVAPHSPEWSYMAGWTYWRLYVTGQQYGLVPKLQGPQFFVQRRAQMQTAAQRETLGGRSWWSNARLAFLGDRGFPGGMESFELGLGGGIEVAWVGRRRPLSVTLDFSRLQFTKEASTMALHNLIFGLSWQLY